MEYFVAAPKANEIISRYRAFQEEVRPMAGDPCMKEVREQMTIIVLPTIIIFRYSDIQIFRYSDIQSSRLVAGDPYVGRGEGEK